jgi:ABC-type nitrate/sulfonate/bicarbonate transport system substrate-binding protein
MVKVRYGFLALALALGLASAGAQAADLTTVKAVVVKSSLATVIHEIAEEGGYYTKNGLKVQEVSLRSGQGSNGAQVLLAGDADAYIGTLSDITRLDARALEAGQSPPLAAVAAGSIGSTGLVLRNDIPFKTITDIKGLRIGVSSLGSDHLVRLRYYLSTQSIPFNDLQLKLVPVAGDLMPQALLGGQIDGFLHSQPAIGTAITKANAKLVMQKGDFGEVGKVPGTTVAVRREWAAAHRDTVQRLVNAVYQASAGYASVPRAEMVKMFGKYLPAEPAVLDAAYDNVDPRLYDLRTMAALNFKIEVAAMKERHEVTDKLKPEDVFDFSYTPQ